MPFTPRATIVGQGCRGVGDHDRRRLGAIWSATHIPTQIAPMTKASVPHLSNQMSPLARRYMALSASDSTVLYSKSDCASRIGQPPFAPGRRRIVRLSLIAAAYLALATSAAAQPEANPQAIFGRAVDDFRNGRLEESAAGFDRVAALLPNTAPQLWQRGIVLYYIGRYDDCRQQFESHRTVNPNDVENAAWHFLCVSRAESPNIARAKLLPVGPDGRAPMREIYDMLRGTLAAEAVLAAAGDRASAQFYAHLYVGLYFEALGRHEEALEQIAIAASEPYAASGGYMHTVARVHLDVGNRQR